MAKVHITGYSKNLHKVGMTKAICVHAGLNLSEAKGHTDALLDHGETSISMPTPEAAETLAKRLKDLGAIAEVVH